VFTSSAGTPIDPRNLLRFFKAALERAKLPQRIRFHDLRHSCATFLIAQGEHPRVVMDILGHAQMSTTIDIYGHVMPSTQRAAATKLDDLLTLAASVTRMSSWSSREPMPCPRATSAT
jgi:integrase